MDTEVRVAACKALGWVRDWDPAGAGRPVRATAAIIAAIATTTLRRMRREA